MNLSWKAKAGIQRILSVVPGGHQLNYVLQRHVSRSLPLADSKVAELVEIAVRHVEALRRHGGVSVEAGRFFEFGAGWDLCVPQVLYCLGAGQQTVIDVRRLARAALVTDIGDRLAVMEAPFSRRPPAGLPAADRLQTMRIEYQAPCDARATGLADASVDFVTSTNTLEHVPPREIAQILLECRRILTDVGVMSCQIDYQDHYSYFDSRVSAYNFMQFDAESWRRLNPSLQYQNRLRHRDYLALFSDAGFRVVDADVVPGDAADEALLRSMPLALEFRYHSIPELAIRSSHVVLKPKPNRWK